MKKSDYTYDYLLDAFEQAKSTASSLISETDESILILKPSEEKWSMTEILSHLVQTGNEYLPQIKQALEKPDEKLAKGKPPFTPNFAFRWFIGQVSPENRRKLPTVSAFKPRQPDSLETQEILDEFLLLQDELTHILKRGKLEGWNLDRINARHPLIKLLPISLTACFAIAEAHQRRHFEQLKNLKEQFSS
jgi:hypothetical protein